MPTLFVAFLWSDLIVIQRITSLQGISSRWFGFSLTWQWILELVRCWLVLRPAIPSWFLCCNTKVSLKVRSSSCLASPPSTTSPSTAEGDPQAQCTRILPSVRVTCFVRQSELAQHMEDLHHKFPVHSSLICMVGWDSNTCGSPKNKQILTWSTLTESKMNSIFYYFFHSVKLVADEKISGLCEMVPMDHVEGLVEAVRVFGNLTHFKEVRDILTKNQGNIRRFSTSSTEVQ